ncbi:MAG: phosphoenolpyruvate--protein phosphotransferase, partial [Tenericutes bacterium HGW-Tenericutes-7]
AIRLCLEEQDLFETQLRALLRASTQGNLRIMFPMIATLEEFLSAKNLLEKEKEKLLDEGYEIGSYQLGIMVEIPSAALNANIFAKHVDFFSIGTNDLVQYTFAADRMHEDLEYLYQPFNPAIIALIQMVTNAARKYHIKVSVCGELASDPKAALLLLGLGIDELSMAPTKILKQREIIQKISYEKIKELTKNVIELESEKDIQALILKNMPK